MQTSTLSQNNNTIQENLANIFKSFQEIASLLLNTFIQKVKVINYSGIYQKNAMVVRNFFSKIENFVKSFVKPSNQEYQNNGNKKLFVLVVVVAIIVIALGALVLSSGSSGQRTLGVGDSRPTATTAKEIKEINKSYDFPIKDEKGKEVSKFKYQVVSVELYDSIIVKGQRASAVKGRMFLIVNLKILNENSQSMEINTRDYIRISVNNSSELIAPDIHNDPVEVQAISTKQTRVGVAINESDKNIILHVGEITGKKDQLNIDF